MSSTSISVVAAVVLAVALGSLGLAKVFKSDYMGERAKEVGFSTGKYQLIGTAEVAGAVGVIGGFAWEPIGIAATGGLPALLVGAVVVHFRAGLGREVGPAVLCGAIAVVYLVATTKS